MWPPRLQPAAADELIGIALALAGSSRSDPRLHSRPPCIRSQPRVSCGAPHACLGWLAMPCGPAGQQISSIPATSFDHRSVRLITMCSSTHASSDCLRDRAASATRGNCIRCLTLGPASEGDTGAVRGQCRRIQITDNGNYAIRGQDQQLRSAILTTMEDEASNNRG